VAGVFGRHQVSIRSMEQEGLGDDARLVFITHQAREADVQATLRELRDLDAVKQVGGLLRVVGAASCRGRPCATSPPGAAPELGFADVLLAGLADRRRPVRARELAPLPLVGHGRALRRGRHSR
jgi:hypothetical protein